jgi:hypothetical protein
MTNVKYIPIDSIKLYVCALSFNGVLSFFFFQSGFNTLSDYQVGFYRNISVDKDRNGITF